MLPERGRDSTPTGRQDHGQDRRKYLHYLEIVAPGQFPAPTRPLGPWVWRWDRVTAVGVRAERAEQPPLSFRTLETLDDWTA